MEDPRFSEKPCFVPPHPDLLAQWKSNTLRVQGAGPGASSVADTNFLGPRTGRIPGLNDGTIFPESHFEGAPTLSQMSRAALERAPLRGSIRVAVVLVQFPDKKFDAGAKAHFQDLFFSTGKISTGSVTEYYKEVSNGLISLTGEVLGPYQLRNPSTYYANGNHGYGSAFPNVRTMADEALSAADPNINLRPYDNDGNGYVDGFIVVHAGPGGEQTGNKNDIWSVKWVLPNERTVDGTKVFAFLTIPQDAKIGVSAHELGHLLFGWPDLYDTDYSSAGIGNWCLMAGGSWGGGGDRPVHPSAWCKANQGWIDVINETTNHKITVNDVKSGKKVHRLWKYGSTTSQEYFLVENRQATAFDGALPGGGLLLWHVDDSVDNNTNEAHPKVGLVQADGRNQLQGNSGRGDAGDPYPGSSNNVAFSTASTPNSKSYAGEITYVSVTSIPASSPSMTVNIAVRPLVLIRWDGWKWYRLRNSLSGYALDVINDGGENKDGFIQLAKEGDFSGQYWQINPRPDGTYQIRNLFLGPNRALDVYGDDKTKPHLAQAGYYSGQFWTITPWGDDPNSYHLENNYSGPYLSLDSLEGGTKVALNSGPNAGRPVQRWTFEEIRPITEKEFQPQA